MAEQTLWIVYAGPDDPGDLTAVAAELGADGLRAFYDEVPGPDLWEGIARPVSDPSLDGLAVVVTPGVALDPVRREALAWCLHQVRQARGHDFPVIALLQAVPLDRLGPALRGHGAVSLADPGWRRQIVSILGGDPVQATQAAAPWAAALQEAVGGDARLTAVELSPRHTVDHWRVGVPVSCQTMVGWGRAPSGGITGKADLVDHDRNDVVVGLTRAVGDTRYRFQGCGDPVGELSVYVLFSGRPPKTVAVARADYPDGEPLVDPMSFRLDAI